MLQKRSGDPEKKSYVHVFAVQEQKKLTILGSEKIPSI